MHELLICIQIKKYALAFKNSKIKVCKVKQEMLHILTIAVRQIIHAFALSIENSQILMLNSITFQKRRKFLEIWLFFWVSHIFFFGRKTSRLCLYFIITEAAVRRCS